MIVEVTEFITVKNEINQMEKFLNEVLGTADLPTYLAAFLFAFLGALFATLYDLSRRNINNPAKPKALSFSFFLADNWARFAVGFLATFIALRFSSELFGLEITMKWSFLLGLSINEVAKQIVKSKINLRKKVL
jgi:hypothetical protein